MNDALTESNHGTHSSAQLDEAAKSSAVSVTFSHYYNNTILSLCRLYTVTKAVYSCRGAPATYAATDMLMLVDTTIPQVLS